MSLPIVHTQTGFPSCVHLSIHFNEHAAIYESVAAWIEDEESDGHGPIFDWISPEERQKAIETDSVWYCQWYPHTPVGFCCLAAASFQTLMAAVLATEQDEHDLEHKR